MITVEDVKYYLSLGWPVIPVISTEEKKAIPLKGWKWENLKCEDMAEMWTGEFGDKNELDYNIAVILKNIPWTVIDFDSVEEYEYFKNKFPNLILPTVKSWRGYHIYIPIKLANRDYDCRNLVGNNGEKLPQRECDFKSLGLVNLPPSMHPRGVKYQWIIPIRENKDLTKQEENDIKKYFKELTNNVNTMLTGNVNTMLTEYKEQTNKQKQLYLGKGQNVNIGQIGQMSEGDGRNELLVRVGGYFRHLLNDSGKLLKVLHFFNENFSEPLSDKEIYPMWKKLCQYESEDGQMLTNAIFECLHLVNNIQNVVNMLLSMGIKTNYRVVQQTIYRLMQKGFIKRVGRGMYQAVGQPKTGKVSQYPEAGKPLNFIMPLNISDFCDLYPNALVLLASKEGYGKTHIFADWVGFFLKQGLPVAYWDMENEASAIIATFKKFIPLELLDSDLFSINLEDIDIETLQLAPNKINFIDPIYVEGEHGWARIADVMRGFKKQLDGGICFAASHLKDVKDRNNNMAGEGEVMGGATARKVYSLILYLRHKEDRFHPYFTVRKVRHWKPGMDIKKIECTWDDEEGLSFLRFI